MTSIGKENRSSQSLEREREREREGRRRERGGKGAGGEERGVIFQQNDDIGPVSMRKILEQSPLSIRHTAPTLFGVYCTKMPCTSGFNSAN